MHVGVIIHMKSIRVQLHAALATPNSLSKVFSKHLRFGIRIFRCGLYGSSTVADFIFALRSTGRTNQDLERMEQTGFGPYRYTREYLTCQSQKGC